MTRNSELDLQDEELVDRYTYGSSHTYTITKRRMDTCLLQVYKNGKFLGQVSHSDVAALAESDFKLTRK